MTASKTLSYLCALTICAFFSARVLAADDTSSMEGKAAPEVSLKTIDGKEFKLSAEKGNVVVMDYWATWCPPCRASLPHINEIAANKEYKDKGLKVYAVNSKEESEKVQKYLDENKLTFSVPMDPKGEFGKSYLVRGIPTTVIVGRDGNIKKVFIGFGSGSEGPMKKAIEAALAEPKS